jgi:exodeoxyribonuclease VII large subunit
VIENNENLMIDEEKILKVSEVNRIVKNLLQTKIPKLWISGEISNFVEASSGHWYFTLKDSNAQIRCTMFKGQNSSVTIKPKAGDSIEAFGSVSLYEPRGDYQINLEKIREAGAGNLFEKFLELKMKLEKQGLFDESRKKILPEYPTRVGVITSPSGAALHDVISTLYKNNSPIQTFIYPTAVQGLEAAKKIIKAIEIANERMDVQVLILCRGGGSIEGSMVI